MDLLERRARNATNKVQRLTDVVHRTAPPVAGSST
jgi:hypothetical protein